MQIDAIQAMRQFMGRVQLSGNEVPAFNKCMMALANEEALLIEEAKRLQLEASKAQEAAKADAASKKKPDLRPVPDSNAEAQAGSDGGA